MGNSTWAGFLAAIIIVTISAAGLGCKGKGGTLNLAVDQATNSNKALMSVWTEVNNFYVLDLRQATFGANSAATITAITGQACACQVLIQGGETTGNFTIASCAGAAQCSTYNGTGTYTRTGADLSFCSTTTGCTNLR